MTKRVRIENADTSDHKIRVYVEEKDSEGVWQRLEVISTELIYPTAMYTGTIWKGRRLVVEEI